MHTAFVYTYEETSLFNYILYKRLLKNCKKKEKICDIEFDSYGIPVYKNKFYSKHAELIKQYLKEENIQSVLLSDGTDRRVKNFLSLHFSIIDGNKVIENKVYDILKKCVEKKESEIEKSTVVIRTNDNYNLQNFILQMYRYVKKIKIETENKEKFTELTEYFMREYGLYIDVESNVKDKEEIVISYGSNSNKKADFYFNSKENKQKVLFKMKKGENTIKNYKEIDQALIEFLIYKKNLMVNSEQICGFMKEYKVRIAKIENND
ncbi:MAG: hypothetical protein E7418_04870 [Ruminococcaceae bacterium]|nr:hypothetical protein [Oscillospiraceae bacterium]